MTYIMTIIMASIMAPVAILMATKPPTIMRMTITNHLYIFRNTFRAHHRNFSELPQPNLLASTPITSPPLLSPPPLAVEERLVYLYFSSQVQHQTDIRKKITLPSPS